MRRLRLPRSFKDKLFASYAREYAVCCLENSKLNVDTDESYFSVLNLPINLSNVHKEQVHRAYFEFIKHNKRSNVPYNDPNDEYVKEFKLATFEYLTEKYLSDLDNTIQRAGDNIEPYRSLVNDILSDLKKSPEYENNVVCLIELKNFIIEYTNNPPGQPSEINLENNANYKNLFLRYRTKFNKYNYSLLDSDGNKFATSLLKLEDDIGSSIADRSKPNSLVYVEKPLKYITVNGVKHVEEYERKLFYINSKGYKQEITGVDLNNPTIQKKIDVAIKKQDIGAVRKLLGDKFPRDRSFELAQQMYQKSKSGGSSFGQYVAAQFGDLAAIPGYLTRFVSKSGQNIKGIRAAARRKQVKQDFVAQTFSTITLDRRVDELRVARNMLNSETVAAGLVDTRPCRIRCVKASAIQDLATKESMTFKTDYTQPQDTDTYLITYGEKGKGIRICFIDSSGQTPIKHELTCSELASLDLLYIFGLDISKVVSQEFGNSWRPNQKVQMLRDKFKYSRPAEDDAHRKVDRELFSFITLITGHIPEHQVSDDLLEKYEFNQQCAALETLIGSQEGLRQELKTKLSEYDIELLDENRRPDVFKEGKTYLYVDSGSPPRATMYNASSNAIKEDFLYKILEEKNISSEFLFLDYEKKSISQAAYDQLLEWSIAGRKTPCPILIEPGKVYSVEGKLNSKVWYSHSEGIIIDVCDNCSRSDKSNRVISHNSATFMSKGFKGFRYIKGNFSYKYNQFSQNAEVNVIQPSGQAVNLRIPKVCRQPALIEKSKSILSILRKIEDLPASYITTQESIVPYDTRRELVTRLSEYVSNPNAKDASEYFRGSYTLVAAPLTKDTYNKGAVCTFYYDSSEKSISYVDANRNVFSSKINSFMNNPIDDLLQGKASLEITSEQVYEKITKNLEPSTAFKMHTANEAILEVVDEEVVSTKEACKYLAQALLVLGITLLFAFVPIFGQAAAIPGIGIGIHYFTMAMQCISIPYLFAKAAHAFSKNPKFTSARQELMKLKEEVAALSRGEDATPDIPPLRLSGNT